MLVGEFRNQVDRIWDDFAAGGLVNPLAVIEQFTYLMFMKQLDDRELGKERLARMGGGTHQSIFPEEKIRWHVFISLEANERFQIVSKEAFDFIKNLNGDGNSAYSRHMENAIFLIPTPALLEKVVLGIDKLLRDMQEYDRKEKDNPAYRDSKGDLYEYLLSKLSQAGRNGQFRTPRHIIDMMVKLMKPELGHKICDPAMGSAGFLVSAAQEIWKANFEKSRDVDAMRIFNQETFYGFDTDQTMLRIGAMNMMLHQVENPAIHYQDSLSDQNEKDREHYDLILANPPFKGSLDEDRVAKDLLRISKTKKTELLFVALFIKMLKIGGRCACIVPDGVLFSNSKAHKDLRKELIENQQLEAVISMPSGVFKPYAGVSTGILIFTKTNHGGTDKVWFYDMKNDGYSLDDKRNEIEGSDIPDILARYENRKTSEIERSRKDQSFCVPKDEIIGNDYDLSINKYKELDYEEEIYPHPKEILAEIHSLEAQIQQGLKELEGMIGE